jgi:hypothetical protein
MVNSLFCDEVVRAFYFSRPGAVPEGPLERGPSKLPRMWNFPQFHELDSGEITILLS